MKRTQLVVLALVLSFAVVTVSHAQMGMDFFKRPAIASLFKPVVGAGAVYESTGNDGGGKSSMELTVIGKDTAEGKEAIWIEVAHSMKGVDGYVYNKALITKDDFHIVKTIMQIPGHPAMEMRLNPSGQAKQGMQDEMNQWTQVGTESITVPAGTFSCQHWAKKGSKNEIWASDKISPFGMVKEINGNGTSTEVLIRVISNAKDHITGPVSPYDPQLFRQIIMDQMGKQKP